MNELLVVHSPRPTLEVLVMRIQTQFASEDEFIAAFRRYVDDTSCFIPTTTPRAVGIETAFSIRLASGQPVLRGLCVVLDAWATDDNPYRRAGVRLGIRTLTRETKPIYDRMLTTRLALGSSPDLAAQAAAAVDAHPTVQMPPLFPPADDFTHDDAAEAMDAIPVPIDAGDATGTQRYMLDTIPMRAPAPTLLGVAPIAIPRTLTPRARVTMPALDGEGTPALLVDRPLVQTVVVRTERTWWARMIWRARTWLTSIRWARRRRRAERMR